MYHKIEKLARILLQEDHFLWIPIFFGTGISLYFSLPYKLSITFSLSIACLFGLILLRYYNKYLLIMPVLLMSLGFCCIQIKTHFNNTTLLKNYNGLVKITGTVQSISRFSNMTQIVIKQKKFNRMIRISARGKLQPSINLYPETEIEILAVIKPLADPIFPGAFNFKRHLYYQNIGATGFAVKQPKILKKAGSIYQNISSFRTKITNYIHTIIPKTSSHIVAALVTGDKSAISLATKEAFADAGVAHILAISGLHLSIIVGFVFLAVRLGLCCIPSIANRYNTKKIAAIIAILISLIYLIISGANVPIQRAFFMNTVLLLSVCIDRIAFTSRNIALAALFILIIKPESLITPSFQLSFAAVTALVAIYEKYYDKFHLKFLQDSKYIRKLCFYFISIIISSIIVTAATAPFTVLIFHKISLIAILTNLIAIPLVSFVIMPSIFIILLSPIKNMFLIKILDNAIGYMCSIANYAQKFDNAILLIPGIPSIAKWFLIIGIISTIVAKNIHIRLTSLLTVSIGIILAWQYKLPNLYIHSSQKFFAINTPSYMLVNTLQAERFSRKAMKNYFAKKKVKKTIPVNTKDNILKYKISEKVNIEQICHQRNKEKICQIKLIINDRIVLSSKDFNSNGSYFIWFNGQNYRLQNVKETSGQYPWSFN